MSNKTAESVALITILVILVITVVSVSLMRIQLIVVRRITIVIMI